jgi:hypothetical protein
LYPKSGYSVWTWKHHSFTFPAVAHDTGNAGATGYVMQTRAGRILVAAGWGKLFEVKSDSLTAVLQTQAKSGNSEIKIGQVSIMRKKQLVLHAVISVILCTFGRRHEIMPILNHNTYFKPYRTLWHFILTQINCIT